MKTLFVSGEQLRHFADSSQQRNGQAWFVPDTDRQWVAAIYPAIKITRLGTHIAEKFAGRYYDSVSAVSIFVPESLAEAMADVPERFFVSDSAYCLGDGCEVGTTDAVHNISAGSQTLTFSCGELGVDRIISEISRFATLKMGDLIIFGNRGLVSRLTEGERFEVTLDGRRSIELRIK
ncbi:MAG: hypothetical protein K2J10_06625 [Muribaculaceae bacterium]|nr:hypothetical protein [Muribaculaceae bacterium]